jgi:hypothetical protein
VFNGRLYRASFAPLLLALIIAGFSLTAPSGSYSSTLAPDAFNGAAAYAELDSLAARFPQRQPGSHDDNALAAEIAHTLEGLGGSASGGFSVSVRHTSLGTVYGRRTLSTVIARRPGLTGASPIVLLAHRDAAGRRARAELSGTAVLLQLARVLAGSETQRAVIVVSTSDGSGGAGGAAGFAANPGGPVDAAIVLGNLAGATARKPFVLPYSNGLGQAPTVLTNTVSAAVTQQIGIAPGTINTLDTLARFALPLNSGEQGPLLAHGIPAVALQVSGERPPRAGEPISAMRLENFGRAVLSAVYALDTAPNLSPSLQTGLSIQHKLLPLWAVRLLVFALLLGPLIVLIDGFARLLRRQRTRRALSGSEGRASASSTPRVALLWTLACSLPFLLAALFTRLLGLAGVLDAPAGLVPALALPSGRLAVGSVLAPVLVLALAWLAWPALMRRLGLPAFGLRTANLDANRAASPGVGPRTASLDASRAASLDGDLRTANLDANRAASLDGGHAASSDAAPRAVSFAAAGLAALLLLLGVALLVWLFNPYAALLLVPALHLWLAVVDPQWRAAGPALHRVRALLFVAFGLLPLALLLAVDAHRLGYGVGRLAQAVVLLLAGGFLGIPAMLIWCLVLGCLAAVILVALSPTVPHSLQAQVLPQEGTPVTVRGPLSYAGPGSLGGTESALRR